MELDIPATIRTQLLTLSESERAATLTKLSQLAENPERMGGAVRKSRSDSHVWTVRLSGRLRALVREEGTRLHVLAVAPTDQLTPYLEAGGKRVA